MGRMITGDIEGKCWFGVQSSDFADRFGETGQQPNVLQYYFDDSNLSEIESELKYIETKWGVYLERIKKYFDEYDSYTEIELMQSLQIDSKRMFLDLLCDYADYEYGLKIRDCVKDKGYCEFEVEI